MTAELRGFAFISLLRDELEARGLAGLLESVARSTAEVASIFLVPEVRGLDFFAAPARQAEVDRWWARNMPSASVPVYLLCHEEGLADWLPGLDGLAIVATNTRSSAVYAAWTVVNAEPAEAPLALAEAAIVRFGTTKDPLQKSLADIFNRRDAGMVAGLRSDASLNWRTCAEFHPLFHVDGVRADPIRSRPPIASDSTNLVTKNADQPEASSPSERVQSTAKPFVGARSRLRERLPILKKRTERLDGGAR